MTFYDYTDALIKDYLPEGWVRSDFLSKVYLTTSPVEFKNFISAQANSNCNTSARIVVGNMKQSPQETIYAFAWAEDLIHDDICDTITDYYGGTFDRSSYEFSMIYFPNIKTAQTFEIELKTAYLEDDAEYF